jgi:ribonuclease Z
MNMLPKPPPREPTLGFLYLPPFRVQGTTVAGEATSIAIPEYDIVFDLGACPRPMLAMKYAAITHGHMDHIGGLAYFCSQRYFQGMGEANIICDPRIAPAIEKMMAGYVELERQNTPYKLITLAEGAEFQIKNNIVLRGFAVEHTAPAYGYTIIERRTKLKDEFVGLPQDKLKELRDRGIDITRAIEVPQIAYIGDTAPTPALIREDVRKANIAICECTFAEPEHKDRAKVGMHMHIDALAEWIKVLECNAVVLTHISRRTNLSFVRKRIYELAGAAAAKKVHILMDYKVNKERFEQQLIANGQKPEDAKPASSGGGGSGGGGGRRPGGGGGNFRRPGGPPPFRDGPPRRDGGGGAAPSPARIQGPRPPAQPQPDPTPRP